MRHLAWRRLRRALVLSLLSFESNVLGATACDIMTDPECSKVGGPCGDLFNSCCSGLMCDCDVDDNSPACTCRQ